MLVDVGWRLRKHGYRGGGGGQGVSGLMDFVVVPLALAVPLLLLLLVVDAAC